MPRGPPRQRVYRNSSPFNTGVRRAVPAIYSPASRRMDFSPCGPPYINSSPQATPPLCASMPLSPCASSSTFNPLASPESLAVLASWRPVKIGNLGNLYTSALLKITPHFYPKTDQLCPKTTPLCPQNTPTSSNFLQLFGPHRHKCAHPNRYILPILTYFFSFPAPRSRPPPPFPAQEPHPPLAHFCPPPWHGATSNLITLCPDPRCPQLSLPTGRGICLPHASAVLPECTTKPQDCKTRIPAASRTVSRESH